MLRGATLAKSAKSRPHVLDLRPVNSTFDSAPSNNQQDRTPVSWRSGRSLPAAPPKKEPQHSDDDDDPQQRMDHNAQNSCNEHNDNCNDYVY
jgi:hypothetical protein